MSAATDYEPIKFSCSYLNEALFDLPKIIERAVRDFEGIDADTLVGTGFSGAIVIPALALALDKRFVLIRKDNDDSHHGRGKFLGSLGSRWFFVDDFTSSGATKKRVLGKVAKELDVERDWLGNSVEAVEHVGDYYYQSRFRIHEPNGTPWETYADGVTLIEPTW